MTLGEKPMATWAFALALLLAAALAFVFVWDAVALFYAGPSVTISAIVIDWSRQNPLLPFFVGVMVGHLFFPARLP